MIYPHKGLSRLKIMSSICDWTEQCSSILLSGSDGAHNSVMGGNDIFNDHPGGSLPFNYVPGVKFSLLHGHPQGVYSY